MREMIVLDHQYTETGYQGSTEHNRWCTIEKTSGEKEISLVYSYSKESFPSKHVLEENEQRYTVSVDDLIAFFHKHGTRTETKGPPSTP